MANSSGPSAQNSTLATSADSASSAGDNAQGMKTLFSGNGDSSASAPTASISSQSASPNSILPQKVSPAGDSGVVAASVAKEILPIAETNSPTSASAIASFAPEATSSTSATAPSASAQSISAGNHQSGSAFKQAFVPATSVPEISPALESSDVIFNQEDASMQHKQPAAQADSSASPNPTLPGAGILGAGQLGKSATQDQQPNSASSSSGQKSFISFFNPETLKKLSTKQWILIGGGLVIFIALIALIISLFSSGSSEPVATPAPVAEKTIIEYWGLWESSEIMNKVFSDFEAETGISVKYVKKDIEGYRLELQNVLSGTSSGTAPDVFRYHFSWVPMLSDSLDVAPSNYFSRDTFTPAYYPIATENMVNNAGVIGIPLMYEGLTLVYNKDLFEAGGVSAAPADWTSFGIVARQLTNKNDAGQITQAGAAIGLADNIDHFSDLFGVLALQNGVDLKTTAKVDDESALISTLEFYDSFYIDPETRVWDENMADSIVAFAEGRVAMIFVPSFRILDILALNPNLNIGVAPLPTIDNTETGSQTWATFWVEGVSAKSKNKTAAWKLLEYLSRPDVQRTFFAEAQAMGRYFGEMYPRTSMASELSKNAYLQPYLYDAPSAQNFYLNDNTFDGGLNDTMIDYYAEVINDLTGQTNKGVDPITPTEAATRLRAATQEVLATYLVPKDESK